MRSPRRSAREALRVSPSLRTQSRRSICCAMSAAACVPGFAICERAEPVSAKSMLRRMSGSLPPGNATSSPV